MRLALALELTHNHIGVRSAFILGPPGSNHPNIRSDIKMPVSSTDWHQAFGASFFARKQPLPHDKNVERMTKKHSPISVGPRVA
ncbi:hypothetical protein EC915_10184 [Pseudomonas sp. LP_7_YM]|nr:hypothetical protein EC915_10184 [Pseudomonas sp. LP_7_YM]